jgi:putative FmdB family regulatory protein
MPTYEYRCRDCGHTFDVVQAMSDETLTVCPACGGELRKVFAPPAISFKGSGFYATDHGKKSKSTSERSGEATGEKTAEKPAASTESSGSKSEKKDKKEPSKTTEKTVASSSAATNSGGSGSAGSTSDGRKDS